MNDLEPLLQPPRKHLEPSEAAIDEFLEVTKRLAAKHGCTVAEVIEARKVLEMQRQNNLYHANGNVHDDQMLGFGSLLQGLISALKVLAGKLR